MYSQNISVRRVPELQARSGSVLLHFFSDDAYNMSGFNISYKINGCPTDNSSVNCSGHGVCNELDGTCDCDNDYHGFACQTPRCPNDCSKALGRGICEDRRYLLFIIKSFYFLFKCIPLFDWFILLYFLSYLNTECLQFLIFNIFYDINIYIVIQLLMFCWICWSWL